MTVLKVLFCIPEITHWKPHLGTSCSENWEEKDGREWRVREVELGFQWRF